MRMTRNHFYIQARLCSQRLPGKVLKKMQDKTILEIILERLLFIKNKNEIFILTGDDDKNKEIIEEAKRLGVEYFSGSENNVLDRFVQASNKFESEIITRITADCPLIDFNIIEKGLKIFDSKKMDILSNNKIKTYPHGFDFEIFKKSALDESWKDNFKRFSSKRIFLDTFIPPTKYMLEESKFVNHILKNDLDLSHIRITLDYEEDFRVIKNIFDNLYPKNHKFALKEILEYLKKNPKIVEINKKYLRS